MWKYVKECVEGGQCGIFDRSRKQGWGKTIVVAVNHISRPPLPHSTHVHTPTLPHTSGWSSVDQYYASSSSSLSVPHIRVPLLCLQALDDPIAPKVRQGEG